MTKVITAAEAQAEVLSALSAALVAGTVSQADYDAAVAAIALGARTVTKEQAIFIRGNVKSVPAWATEMQVTSLSKYGGGNFMPNAYTTHDIAGVSLAQVQALVTDFTKKDTHSAAIEVTFRAYNR